MAAQSAVRKKTRQGARNAGAARKPGAPDSKNSGSPGSPGTPGTREKIVHAAADLFYLQGYQGASLEAVAQQAGVNRGSLYYFFRSKKNLALAVIGHFERMIHENFLAPALKSPGGREKLARLAELYSTMPLAAAPCCGCPIGKLSLELSGLDEELRLRLKGVWEGVLGEIEGMVRQAREEGSLPASSDPHGLARAFFSQIQGAHIIARSVLDEEALRADCRRAFEGLSWIN